MISRIATGGLLAVLAMVGFNADAAVTLPDSGTVYYELSNHPDGSENPPPYGLRLDGLFGDNSQEVTFDFDDAGSSVGMSISADGTIVIIGQNVLGGIDGGTDYSSSGRFDFEFTYQAGDVEEIGGALRVQDANAGDGTGSITYLSGNIAGVAANDSWTMYDQTNGNYSFEIGMGHRLPGDNSTITGHGWLTHSASASHVYASDWLFIATPVDTPPPPFQNPVPVPPAVGLAGIAMAGLAAYRRVRK